MRKVVDSATPSRRRPAPYEKRGVVKRLPLVPVVERPATPVGAAAGTTTIRGMASTSRTSLDLARGHIGKKPSLVGKEFVLDIENVRDRQTLTKDITKLGGTVSDYLSEEKPPTCVISDHAEAGRVESLQNRRLTQLRALPALLREAYNFGVPVRTVAQFRKSFETFKEKVKAGRYTNIPPNAPTKQRNRSLSKGRNAHLLVAPFVKMQKLRTNTRCTFREFPMNEPKIYLGDACGRSIFHPAGEGTARRRAREAAEDAARADEGSDGASSSTASIQHDRRLPALGGGKRPFCEICHLSFDEDEPHFESRTHKKLVHSSAFYDEVDMECGSFVDWISGVTLKKREVQKTKKPLMTMASTGSSDADSGVFTRSSRRSLVLSPIALETRELPPPLDSGWPEIYKSPF